MGRVGDLLDRRLGNNLGFMRVMQIGQFCTITFALPAFFLIETRKVIFAVLGQFLLVIGILHFSNCEVTTVK